MHVKTLLNRVHRALVPGGSQASITTTTVATNVPKKNRRIPPPGPNVIGIC